MGVYWMPGPKISVLMGVYCRGPDTALLERSVQSILAQSWTDLEFFICDDGSHRAAAAYLDSVRRRDRRIRLLRRGDLITLPAKLNACLAQTESPLIARMDDDDYARPDRLSKQELALRTNPAVAFVGSNAALYRDGRPAGRRILPEFPTVQDFLLTQPYLHPALMFRREALLALGGYSEDPRALLCEDYDLLLRLYGQGFRGMNLQEELLTYTLPHRAKGDRRMRHRWNESVTRYRRFRDLGLLPRALPYVLKPLAVGLLPEPLLKKLKGLPL